MAKDQILEVSLLAKPPISIATMKIAAILNREKREYELAPTMYIRLGYIPQGTFIVVEQPRNAQHHPGFHGSKMRCI